MGFACQWNAPSARPVAPKRKSTSHISGSLFPISSISLPGLLSLSLSVLSEPGFTHLMQAMQLELEAFVCVLMKVGQAALVPAPPFLSIPTAPSLENTPKSGPAGHRGLPHARLSLL